MSTKIDELFYELNVQTRGFDEGIKAARASLGKFSKFVQDNPVAAMAGLGAAFVGMALKAADMAKEVNGSIKRAVGYVPGAVDQMDSLKGAVRELSLQFGVSQKEVADNMLETARAGQRSASELLAVQTAVMRASRATGESFTELLNGTDQVLKQFQFTGDQSTQVLGQLFAVAKGHTSISELLATFKRLAPVIQGTGVDFNTMSAAMGYFVSQGWKSRQIMATLTQVAKTQGAEGLKKLADRFYETAGGINKNVDGMVELNKQFDRMQKSSTVAAGQIKANFSAVLIDLGQRVLPPLTSALRAIVETMDLFSGRTAKIVGDAQVNSVKMLSDSVMRLNENVAKGGEVGERASSRQGAALDALRLSLGNLAAQSDVNDTSLQRMGRNLEKTIHQQSVPALKQMQAGLAALAQSGKLSEKDMGAVTFMIQRLAGAIAKAKDDSPLPDIVTPEGTRALGEATDGIDLLGDSLDDASKDAAEFAEKISAAWDETNQKFMGGMKKVRDLLAESTLTLVDDLEAAMQDLREELEEAGVSVEAIEEALRPYNDQLKLVRINEQFKLPEILDKAAEALTAVDLQNLNKGLQALRTASAGVKQETKEKKAIDDESRAVTLKIVEANMANANAIIAARNEEFQRQQAAAGTHKTYKETLATIEKTVTTIADIATGAIGVASAFGLIDSKAASTLNSVISMATALPRALGGDPTAIFSVIGSLSGIIGGLFGENPETRARKELLKQNTKALDGLTKATGDLLKLQQSGSDIVQIRDALKGMFSSTGKYKEGSYTATKKRLGLTDEDFEQIASDLGITLRNKQSGKIEPGALRVLMQALQGLDSGFAQTWKGQMDRIEEELKLGLLDPSKKFGAIAGVLGTAAGSRALAGAVSGGDLTTTEGRAALRAGLQGVFKAFTANQIKAEDLGGMSASDFLDTIEELMALVTEAEDAARAAAEKAAEEKAKADEDAADAKAKADKEAADAKAKAEEERQRAWEKYQAELKKADEDYQQAVADLAQEKERTAAELARAERSRRDAEQRIEDMRLEMVRTDRDLLQAQTDAARAVEAAYVAQQEVYGGTGTQEEADRAARAAREAQDRVTDLSVRAARLPREIADATADLATLLASITSMRDALALLNATVLTPPSERPQPPAAEEPPPVPEGQPPVAEAPVDPFLLLADLTGQSLDAELAMNDLLAQIATNTATLLRAPWVDTAATAMSPTVNITINGGGEREQADLAQQVAAAVLAAIQRSGGGDWQQAVTSAVDLMMSRQANLMNGAEGSVRVL